MFSEDGFRNVRKTFLKTLDLRGSKKIRSNLKLESTWVPAKAVPKVRKILHKIAQVLRVGGHPHVERDDLVRGDIPVQLHLWLF